MKEMRFSVPPDTTEINISFIHPGGNFHLGFLVWDSLKRFRGWVSLKKGRKDLKISNVDSKHFHGMYVPFGEWRIVAHTRDRVEEFDYRIEVDFVRQRRTWNWVKGEFHTHTVMSDGKWTVEELAGVLKELDVDFFFVTDHNVFGLKEQKRVRGILALPGIEITSPVGHFLILGAKPGEVVEPFDFDEMKKRIFGPAHPKFPNDDQCKDCYMDLELESMDMDFVEIWNCVYEGRDPHDNNMKAFRIWEKMVDSGRKVSLSAGGDIHDEEFREYWIPSWVYVPELSLDAILNSLKEGLVIVGNVKPYGEKVNFEDEVEIEVHTEEGTEKMKSRELNLSFKGERFVAFKNGRFVSASAVLRFNGL